MSTLVSPTNAMFNAQANVEVDAAPITRAELHAIVLDPSRASRAKIVEVLGEAYWRAGHIPGATFLPLDQVAAFAKSHAAEKQSAFIFYCASDTCPNSHIAGRKLVAEGFTNVRVYAGGKADWKDAGLTLEK